MPPGVVRPRRGPRVKPRGRSALLTLLAVHGFDFTPLSICSLFLPTPPRSASGVAVHQFLRAGLCGRVLHP